METANAALSFLNVACDWLTMREGFPLAVVGLGCDIAGAWLVAWEVVNRFEKEIYLRPKDWDLQPEKNPEYLAWDRRRHRRMSWGLGCLTLGFILQGVGAWF